MKTITRIIALTVLLATVVTRGAITDGLVSYWPMDATNGTTTPDMSFANTMSIVGPAFVVANTNRSGQFSNAMQFNGSSTRLTNLHSIDRRLSGLPIVPAGRYTIAMWVKSVGGQTRFIFTQGNVTNDSPALLIQTGNTAGNTNKIDMFLRNTRGQNLVNHVGSTNTVFDNTWHHFAFVDNRGTVKLYIDGIEDGASTNGLFNYVYREDKSDINLNSTALGNLIRVTAPAAAQTFNGQLDEVGLWDRPLSQDEVNQVMTNGIYTPATQVPSRQVAVTVQPSDAVKKLGEWHAFSVDAIGNPPITYQWSKNGSPITDATNQFYQATGLQTNNTGDYYSCAVTNPTGFAITTNGTLTVLDDPTANTTNGLVNYWPMDVYNETTNTPDLHFGHYMQMFGMNTNLDIVAGQFSNAAAFFATPAPGTFGNRVGGTPIYSRTNYTVALWVKGSLLQADRRFFSEGRNGAGTNNNPIFALGTDNAATGTTPSIYPFVRSDANVNSPIVARVSTRPVFDGNWHHVVWTDANGQGKLYIDGNLDETDYRYTRPALTLDLTMIGVVARGTATFGLAPVNPFTGNLDEVATWSRVLTWTEIQQIMTNGVPVPDSVVLAPTISSQPQNKTNGTIFVGDDVTFTVGVNGTPPFDYRWRRNGAPIDGIDNPTAFTDTLMLTNVQLVDSNTTYSVVVTNGSGSVTSSVARLFVSPVVVLTNGEVLRVDVGSTGSPNPQPGFQELLGVGPASFGQGVRVSLSGIGAPIEGRQRTTPVNSPPALTQAQLYQDFIFANSTADATGMRVLIERLATNASYGLTVWSFDTTSTGTRVSSWEETSGTPVTITNDYTFNGANSPTSDYQYTFGALLTSSAEGKLQIDGIRQPTSVNLTGVAAVGAFVNAIRLVANPVATGITKAAVVGGNLQITTETEYPGMTPNIEQSNSVTGPWVTATGGTIISSVGPVVVVEFAIDPNTNLFYRGKRKP